MTKLRGEYEELLNLLRDSNEVVNNAIILHKNGKLKEAEFWQVLAQESDKTKIGPQTSGCSQERDDLRKNKHKKRVVSHRPKLLTTNT